MTVIYRAQCIFGAGNGLPRDSVVINPCFRDVGVASNPANLASDLLNIFKNKFVSGATRPITIKLYDLQGTKPVYPAATAVQVGSAGVGEGNMPREIALCLSFYKDNPRPSQRGRLYFPIFCLTSDNSTLGLRPSSTIRSTVGGFASDFAALGGADVDWIVWSDRNSAAHKVTNWWVDDEWDIVRRRGLRPTARTSGTTSG